MEAIRQVRSVCNERCFLAGFSVVIKDTRDVMDGELPIFVGLAVLLALAAMSVTLESTVLPFVYLASIGMAVVYNFGSNIFLGQISYITKAIAAVQNTISVVPSQSGSLTYNGGTQLPSWNNLALEMMTITYGEDRTPAEDYQGETDAGTYKAYITPKEGYTWGDKSADEKEVLWTIQRATIATVPSVSGSLSYTGEAQVPTWLNFNPAQLTKTETAQTNAGEHSTSFSPNKNYQWSGGDTSAKVVKWTIAKAVNTFSVAPSGAQSVDVGDTVVIQVTSNSDAQIAATADNPASVEVTVDQANKRVTVKGASRGRPTSPSQAGAAPIMRTPARSSA